MVRADYNCRTHFTMGYRLYSVFDSNRYWYLGAEQNSWLGMGHHQLCMVGRYWSRRHPYLRSIVALSPEVENGHQQVSRGNDDFCRYDGRRISRYPHGAYLACILGSSVAKPVRFAVG